ncbi:Aldehyde/histidinol dehydrogenase [Gorgonomyces haynaldii]|nr:Aldehyde/histidinol dehydrogenase [Gorgonomyces haynaldii]
MIQYVLVAGLLVWFLLRKQTKKLVVDFPKEAYPEWTNKEYTFKGSKDEIQCYDPATGFDLGTVPVIKPEQVKAIVDRARLAQQQYKQTSFETRRQLLQSILDWVVDNQDQILNVCARDSGKTKMDGSFGEILTTCERLRWTIEHGERVLQPEYRAPGLIMSSKTPTVEFTPYGVMGCIISWNYPFHNCFGPIVSALMAGNACVVKCSEHVAWSTQFWQSVFSKALELHGLDPNLVVLMNGYAETGQALIDQSDKITFIGSPKVGKMIMKQASARLTPVVLELGGKDCAVAFNDCDFNQFAPQTLRLCFQNAGQNCAGLERVIIQSGIHDKFVDYVSERVKNFRVGPALLETVDVGAITMPAQLDIVEHLLQDAVSKGAKIAAGGKRFVHPKYPKGQFFEPTILTNVTMDMKIATEEVFGPVMVVFKFEAEQEAIDIANGSEFGLGSGVFTLDLKRADRICSQLKVGMTNVNAFGVNYLCQGLPFGGVGISGVDCFSGVEGLRGQCYPRAVTHDRFSFLRTSVPGPLLYPLTKKSDAFQQALIQILYGKDLQTRFSGIKGLITASF